MKPCAAKFTSSWNKKGKKHFKTIFICMFLVNFLWKAPLEGATRLWSCIAACCRQRFFPQIKTEKTLPGLFEMRQQVQGQRGPKQHPNSWNKTKLISLFTTGHAFSSDEWESWGGLRQEWERERVGVPNCWLTFPMLVDIGNARRASIARMPGIQVVRKTETDKSAFFCVCKTFCVRPCLCWWFDWSIQIVGLSLILSVD